MEVAIQHKV